ncbi:tRNA A64-2'-O-ribosylphosphate transferase [Martiniozyma asiatica (nom. inval.)]|nr:tRNA A64-2'-O-ribosylphosphate transferase [Martiniozyma asiatica]
MDPLLKQDLSGFDKQLHKSNLSLRNRLLSIQQDCAFISKLNEELSQNFHVLLCANERCGSWYVDPNESDMSCYFKSTDGHTNEWSFSTRRINLHLLSKLKNSKTVLLIVDSTRRGKRFPDSLSKTIPIWCSVLNKLNNDNVPWQLNCPMPTVSKYERERILDLLPDMLDNVKKVRLEINVHGFFKPLFVCPLVSGDQLNDEGTIKSDSQEYDNTYFPIPNTFSNFPMLASYVTNLVEAGTIPVICAMSSKKVSDGWDKSRGFSYVQGAGDDHELWSRGLTPSIFWQNQNVFSVKELLKLDDEQVDRLVDKIVNGSTVGNNLSEFYLEKYHVVDGLEWGEIKSNSVVNCKDISQKYDFILLMDGTIELKNKTPEITNIVQVPLQSGSKKSAKLFRSKIPQIMSTLSPIVANKGRLLVLCNNGQDLSICVILACLSLHYTKDWEFTTSRPTITKTTIRQHMIKLLTIKSVNPQRATLNSLNSYLMN